MRSRSPPTPLFAQNLQTHQLSLDIHRAEEDRLKAMGYAVIPLDYPPQLIFTPQQRNTLRARDYRPDYLILSQDPGPLHSAAFWEVQLRIPEEGELSADDYVLIPSQKLEKWWEWSRGYGLPFFLSVYFGRKWRGYCELGKLQVLEERRSEKRGYLEIWAKVSLRPFRGWPYRDPPVERIPELSVGGVG